MTLFICHDCGCEVTDDNIFWVEGDLVYCENCYMRDDISDCDYCGQSRWRENLFRYENKKSDRDGEMMCIGCIEEMEDEEYANIG